MSATTKLFDLVSWLYVVYRWST